MLKKLVTVFISVVLSVFLIGCDETIKVSKNPVDGDNQNKIIIETSNNSGYQLEYIGDKDYPIGFKINKQNNGILEYTIRQFNSRSKSNWNIFQNPPKITGKDIKPGSFDFFNNSAIVFKDKIIFSIHKYAIATYTSFLGTVDIQTQKTNLIDKTFTGSINKIIPNKENNLLVIIQDTARGAGSYLSIIDIENMSIVSSIGNQDIKEKLNEDEKNMIGGPNFDSIEFDNNSIKFTTSDLENKKRIKWSIDIEGNNLKQLNNQNN